jgi:dual specificity phosphatase 12
MGKSRSATIVIAYMMSTFHMTPTQALAQLRESRGVCEPNPGFMKQLELYYEMSTPEDVESNPSYQRWLYQRELDAARAAKIAPDADKIRFGDEHVSEGTRGETAEAAQADAAQPGGPTQIFEMKCRKCRRTLANSSYLIAHEPPAQNPHNARSAPVPPSTCAHLFLEPLSWMRSQLEQGQLEGRLECPNPKCNANVGKYAWQGMQCTCGEWVVPGISLIKSRIDEHKMRGAGKAGPGDDMGIRRPPGARGAAGSGNL